MEAGDPDIAVLERFFAAVYRHDVDGEVEVLAEDVEWQTMRELPGGGTFRGRADVARVLRDQEEMFAELTAVPGALVRVGEQIVAEVHVTGRHRGSDARIDMHVGQVWRLRAGRVVSFRAFREPAEAHAVAHAEVADS